MLKKDLSYLHDNYAVVPTDYASNNMIFVCKSHIIT